MVGIKSISREIFGALETAMSSNRFFDGHHPRDPAVAKMFGLGTTTAAGVKVSHDTTMAIPAVFRGINIISNSLARIPFYVFEVDKEEGKKYAKGHTSWRAVAIDPHPETKMVDFRRIMTAWAIGWGNAIAHIHRPGWPFGGPVELTPLLPDRTIPVRITERMVKNYDVHENLLGLLYYQTRVNDIEISFPASDCLHIRGLGPSTYWGYDIVELLVQAIGGTQAKAEFGHRFYGQGANPGGFIELASSMSEEAEFRFVESMKRGMEGMGKAHRLMVLEEGAKFHQWTVDPEKAQFIEGLEFDYRVIANVIGIKVHKLIDSANSSYNSLEQANSEHRDDDILPWVTQWTGEYNKKMITDRQREMMTHVVDVDDEFIEGFVPFKERVEGVVMLKNNDIITRDEGRSRLNWGPSRDRNGKRFTIPMNIEFTEDKLSIGDLAKMKGPPPAKNLPMPMPPPDDDDEDPEDEEPTSDQDDQGDEDAIEVDSSEPVQWQYDCREGDLGSVYLDGEEVKYAIACDLNRGEVLVVETDSLGKQIINQDGSRPFVVKQGKVAFVPHEIADKIASRYEAAAKAADKAWNTAKDAWLEKIKARLGKQANVLASKKDVGKFIAWVDGLSTESAPGEMQPHVDELYKTVKNRFLAIVDNPSDTELADAVAAEVESWSKKDNGDS
jgi:HK97 family phage portal protein